MLIKEVVLSEIDLHYNDYKLFDSDVDSKLEKSILAHGLINPVKLLKKENIYIVITGWKRLKVLKKHNSQTVFSQVYEESELTPLQTYTYIYIDNKDRFSDIEKAELIYKLVASGTLEEEEIVNKILPVIGLNPSLNNLKKYSTIASLDREVKEECFNENISFDQLQLLSETDDPEFINGFYNHFLKNYKFNNNEMRDLLKDVQSICIRKNITLDELAENLFTNRNVKTDKNTIRKTIKTICYPKLIETEQKYNELVKGLNLGNTSRLVNHPYFESNDLELRMKFKDKNNLSAELEKLKESLDKGRIDELLKLIKEGN